MFDTMKNIRQNYDFSRNFEGREKSILQEFSRVFNLWNTIRSKLLHAEVEKSVSLSCQFQLRLTLS